MGWGIAIALLIFVFFAVKGLDSIAVRGVRPGNKFRIYFNGESITGRCLILDKRTRDEQKENIAKGKLDGKVVVFFHGHGQQTNNAWHLTSRLARYSRSGIVVVPVLHTPFGMMKQFRGDNGKLVLFMEILRHELKNLGISVDGYKPLCDLPVSINGHMVKEDEPEGLIPAKLLCTGWSHGAILARRFASAYPGSVESVVQFSPGGYESWGPGFIRSVYLFFGFMWEVLCIALTVFRRGEGLYGLDAGWGVMKGVTSDFMSGIWANITGNFHPLKFFKPILDLDETCRVVDDNTAAVPGLSHLVVLYGESDSLYEPEKTGLIKDKMKPEEEEVQAFFKRYAPSAVDSGVHLSLKALPGNHIGPLVHAENYAETALAETEELREKKRS